MTKRTAIVTLTICWLLACCASAWAAEVVVVKGIDIRPYNEAIDGFKSACNCSVTEMTLPENDSDGFFRRIAEQNPAVVLAVGIDALERLHTIRNIPVLYTMVPSSQGIPAGATNISGVSTHVSAEKSLAAMADVVPQAVRIGIIYAPRLSERFIQEAATAAQARGRQLVLRKVDKATDVPAALEGLRDKVDLLWMIPDSIVINAETVKQMLLFSFQNRVPVFTFSRKFVEMGAVAALNVIPYDMGAQAGDLVVGLLSQRQTGPVRITPRKTALVINAKVARKLGLRLKEDLLKRAEDVGR